MSKLKLNITEPIRYIFILLLATTDSLYNIGILTTSYKYYSIEYHTINDLSLTEHSIKNLKRIFYSLKITNLTEVVLNDIIRTNSNIYMFLAVIHKFIGFKFRRTSYVTVLRRILNYHKNFLHTDKLCDKDYTKIYLKLLDNNCCQWITKNTEIEIANLSNRSRRSQKQLRVAMYYMCISRYLANKNKRVKQK